MRELTSVTWFGVLANNSSSYCLECSHSILSIDVCLFKYSWCFVVQWEHSCRRLKTNAIRWTNQAKLVNRMWFCLIIISISSSQAKYVKPSQAIYQPPSARADAFKDEYDDDSNGGCSVHSTPNYTSVSSRFSSICLSNNPTQNFPIRQFPYKKCSQTVQIFREQSERQQYFCRSWIIVFEWDW